MLIAERHDENDATRFLSPPSDLNDLLPTGRWRPSIFSSHVDDVKHIVQKWNDTVI